MTLDPSVFKAYDVRGIVPDELDADGVYRTVRAYVDEFEPRSMAIGRDMRLTSPELCEAAIQAALDAGCDVDEIGLVGTEMLYFAVCEYGYEGGLIVTASHNPKQYNGMKIVRRAALPLGGDGGIEKVRDRALAGEFRTPRRPGRRAQRDVLQGFAERCLSIVDVDAIKPLQGRARRRQRHGRDDDGADPRARCRCGAERLHFEPDGTFPHYQPNPLLEENRQFIIGEVKRTGADLGIAWDGDADRCFFIDDTGEFVPGDFITALDRRVSMLAKRPGETILYDLRASRAVPDLVERGGRHGDREPRRPRLHQAPHAQGERALRGRGLGPLLLPRLLRRGHRHRAGARRARARLALGQEALRAARAAARALPPLGRDQLDGRATCRSSCRSSRSATGRGGEGGRVTHLDGVSVDFDDWHFNVRPSNTEPLLRLNLEAYTAAEMERRRDEVLALIRS